MTYDPPPYQQPFVSVGDIVQVAPHLGAPDSGPAFVLEVEPRSIRVRDLRDLSERDDVRHIDDPECAMRPDRFTDGDWMGVWELTGTEKRRRANEAKLKKLEQYVAELAATLATLQEGLDPATKPKTRKSQD